MHNDLARLSGTCQPLDRLLVIFQAPVHGEKDDRCSSLLQVQAMACRLGMEQHDADLARLPVLNGLLAVHAPRLVFLERFHQAFGIVLELVGDQHVVRRSFHDVEDSFDLRVVDCFPALVLVVDGALHQLMAAHGLRAGSYCGDSAALQLRE